MTQSPSPFDFEGSFVDHALVLQTRAIASVLPSFPECLPSMSLDAAAVWTHDVPPDRRTGDIRKALLDVSQSPRNLLWLLVVKEMELDKCAKIRIGGDLLAFLPFCPHANV